MGGEPVMIFLRLKLKSPIVSQWNYRIKEVMVFFCPQIRSNQWGQKCGQLSGSLLKKPPDTPWVETLQETWKSKKIGSLGFEIKNTEVLKLFIFIYLRF